MYSLVQVLDAAPQDALPSALRTNSAQTPVASLPSTEEIIVFYLEHKLLTPFSQCLALQYRAMLKDNQLVRFFNDEEALGNYLIDLHENDKRILSDVSSLHTLSKGQGICLYLAHFIPNFAVDLVQGLLSGSEVVLVKSYIYVDESINLLQASEQDLLYGSWLQEARVKILDEEPRVFYEDLFYYCYLEDASEWKSFSQRLLQVHWFDTGFPRNTKVLVQGAKNFGLAEAALELIGIHSTQELIDIVASQEGRRSHGIVQLHFSTPEHRYSMSSKLIKYLRGWTFMAAYPASYADYRELFPLANREYSERGRNFFPCTLRNTLVVPALKGVNLVSLQAFLQREGLDAFSLETVSLDDFLQDTVRLHEDSYTLRDTGYSNIRTLFQGTSTEIREYVQTEKPRERHLALQKTVDIQATPVLRVLLVAATWNVFLYDKSFVLTWSENWLPMLVHTQALPKSLQEPLAALLRFFRGVPLANITTRYGYLIYSLDFVQVEEQWQLWEVSAETFPLPHFAQTPALLTQIEDDYFSWLTRTCLLPVLAPQAVRLLPIEFVNNKATLAQFQALVTNEEKMQYIGTGEPWKEEDIDQRFFEYYSDAFKMDDMRDYFDWLLVDEQEQLLAYVSVRSYKYKGERTRQIRVVAAVEGHGYGKRALILAHNDYFLRKGGGNQAREMYAVVNEKNKASMRLFDSLFPTWRRLPTYRNNAIYHCADTPSLEMPS